jgi:chemotaxis protein CheZ
MNGANMNTTLPLSDEHLADEHLDTARALVNAIEGGERAQTASLIDELTRLREAQLYQQLGKLTRELHTSIGDFVDETRIANLAEQEIPDARERLEYVITLTDESAHKTLNAVEESVPLAQEICSQAAELGGRWNKFVDRGLSPKDFRYLSRDVVSFLVDVQSKAKSVDKNLSDVLMAQGFQDLTGQLIRRVITLVEDVQGKLVALVAIAGGKRDEVVGRDTEAKLSEGIEASGPPLPSERTSEVVSGQDEVDDLLASLGF